MPGTELQALHGLLMGLQSSCSNAADEETEAQREAFLQASHRGPVGTEGSVVLSGTVSESSGCKVGGIQEVPRGRCPLC